MSLASLDDWPFDDEAGSALPRPVGWAVIAGLAGSLCLWPSLLEDGQRATPGSPGAETDWPAMTQSVRDRFALSAAVQDCQHTENLYGFDLLLSVVPERRRADLLAAKEDGLRRPKAPSPDEDDCATRLNKLDNADDGLVLWAEKVTRSKP